jgi:signal transduction histidine kinase
MHQAEKIREAKLSAAPKGPRPEAGQPDVPLLAISAGGCITAWNESAGRLLGADLRAGRPAEDLFPGAGAALREHLRPGAARRVFCLAPAGARTGQALALVGRPLTGGGWEAHVLPLVGGSGREAEILSDLLHDLRTPLTALLGAAELLETGRLGAVPERATNLLKAMEGAGRQITEMLEKAAERRAAPPAGEPQGQR